MIQTDMNTDNVAKFPPVGQAQGEITGTSMSDEKTSHLKQQLEELLNPKTPEVDPKAVTKQMLLTCKVFRKRNSNVTPLQSQRDKAPGGIQDRMYRGGKVQK